MYHIYIITNILNAKQYVGITKNIQKRWRQHKSLNGSAPVLHNSIKKHGIENFIFTHIADAFDLESAQCLERLLILDHGTKYPSGYNMNSGGEGLFNPDDFVRKKIAEANKNRSLESRESMSKKLTGRKASEETKQKQALKKIGSKRNEETKKKMSQSLIGNTRMLGKKHSPETIAKMKTAWVIRKAKSSQIKELA
jgi:group I intron endonuclease